MGRKKKARANFLKPSHGHNCISSINTETLRDITGDLCVLTGRRGGAKLGYPQHDTAVGRAFVPIPHHDFRTLE
jgi:hypothetical protein